MRSLRRAAAALAAVALLGMHVWTAAPARACSCIDMRDPSMLQDALGNSGAAFVGTALAREDAGLGLARWIFEVEAVVKGELPERLEVGSAADGVSCGIEMQQGQRGGLLLDKVDGVWQGSLCGQIDAETLLAVGEPSPPSDEAATPGAAPDPPLDQPVAGQGPPLGWIAAGGALAVAVGGGAIGLQRARARRR
ncbi:MAG TPA: hypothetical protein VML96_09170 [Egibacteraceae bacterium]|nr:hypothetical protein [Egibacteraceae bacterium]